MNYLEIRDKAVQWMNERGWREAYGKKGAFTQSLLQHTDIELNVLLSLLPVFARKEHYGLTESEEQSLIVGQIAHDVGKETEKWQTYVRASREEQKGKYVPHVIRPLTDEAVRDLTNTLGFPDSVIPDATKFVNLHMTGTRNSTNTLNALLFHKGESARWNTLARIVEMIDKLCSIHSLLPTLSFLEKDSQGLISPHIKTSRHQISLRGVSSVMLHKAAERAYLAKGWQPLLYFSDGTIYIADGLISIAEPSPAEVMKYFEAEIEQALPQKGFAKMVVGSPTGNFLPKPDLFDYREIREYLEAASKRVGRGSFRKKQAPARRKVVTEFYKLKGQLSAVSDQAVDVESDRVDSAQPEMLVFKFFKAALDPQTVGKNGCFEGSDAIRELVERQKLPEITEQEQKQLARKIKSAIGAKSDEWTSLVKEQYDAVFGGAAFEALMATSTLMPAKEMNGVIEPFWSLPGEKLDLKTALVGDAPDEERMAKLMDALCEVANKAYELIPGDHKPSRASAADIGITFAGDLIHPGEANAQEVAQTQLDSYLASKPRAMKDGDAARLCPICNQPFRNGTVASADFLDKPDSHTNRAVSHGATGYIVICNACKYERFLQQLLLGEKVSRVLVAMPRNHIGRWAGDAFVNKVMDFGETAGMMMSNDTRNPNERISLSLTYMIARNLLSSAQRKEIETDVNRLAKEGLTGAELSRLLSYSLSDDKKKEYRKALYKAILEWFDYSDGEPVESLNDLLGISFAGWDALLDDIVSGDFGRKYPSAEFDEIRAQTQKLQPQLRVICQTPNFALVPMRFGFGGDKESDANAALRELFTLLLIGLALDCSIASIASGEAISFVGGEGIARVPAVPAIRDVVGAEWVSLENARRWLEKIGAASLLAGDTEYPERSNLYQILNALTPGHILRRIEMKSDSGQAQFSQMELIQMATQPV